MQDGALHHAPTIGALRDRIIALSARDDRERPSATHISQIPVSYDAITDEWLTQAVCASTPGARVIGHRPDAPDDGTANRRRIFLEYNEAGREAGLPATVFCKASHDLRHRLTLGISGAAHGEVTFYRAVRDRIDLDIPRSYYAAYDPQSFCSLVMLEDIAADVSFCSHQDIVSFDEACEQMRLLAALHAQTEGTMDELKATTGLIGWPDFFANATAHGQERGSNAGFKAAGDRIPAALQLRFEEVWPATVASVEAHHGLPSSVVHGDCHLKQWYRRRGGGMGLADWQCATIGNWSRDVSYVLGSSLTIADRRAWDAKLLQVYLNERARHGTTAPALKVAWVLYRANMLAALNWWTGTLGAGADMADMQPVEASLTFIERLAHAVDDLGSIDACSELPSLLKEQHA